MRPDADADRIRAFARDLGRHAGQRVRVYLTGGATAVLEGWRSATIDVDIMLEPEDEAIMRRIPAAKEAIPVNVELASPAHFIPELPGWRERSIFVAREGRIDLYHVDPYSQALFKLERALEVDLADVEAMRARGLIEDRLLGELFDCIETRLWRYPAIDPEAFRRRVERFLDRA